MNKDQRNKAVFLITIDALRADHLISYGYHRNTAPNLEKFAEKGLIFLNAITNGPESPTAFSAIFTSILPFLDGGYSPLPSQKITFPQLLKESGVSNYCIHSNPNLGRFFNYDRGFDVFLDGERYKREPNIDKNLGIKQLFSFYIKKILDYKALSEKLMYRIKRFNEIKAWIRNKIPLLTDILLPFTPIAYNAPYVSTKVISLLKKIKKPFFLWAHFMDVHSPYNPPTQNLLNFRKDDIRISMREFLTKKVYSQSNDIQITQEMIEDLQTLYDGEIHFVDELLGNVFKLINLRYKNDCLIILTSDHGESFYEHRLFGHQGSVCEEVLKVPLIIIEMGKKSFRRKVYDIVQLIDIAPTILEYFGLEIPENFQGRSLLPILKGKSIEKEQIIFSECYQKNGLMKRNHKEGYILLSIRKEGWKYIYNEEKEKEYLFNLNYDPGEKTDLFNKNKLKLNEFRKVRDTHIQRSIMATEEKSKIMKAIKTLNINDLKTYE